MKKSIHLGKLIKKKFNESGLTVNEFAQRINRSRTVVYNIFERESIDIKMLEEISRALNYDFIKLYTQKNSIKKFDDELYLVLKVVEKKNLPTEEPYLFIYKIDSND
ncbi:MAG TPA: helix-turn-helix domain-containing protein [Candidatus Barnesiella excrementigallinarum]|nr:helix-turn-helix domain-containing protein [Candidatus Barnesiella excrementigallinarum]